MKKKEKFEYSEYVEKYLEYLRKELEDYDCLTCATPIANNKFKNDIFYKKIKIKNIESKDINMKCIITGGCGFIGHHVVEHLIKNTKWDIIILDKLTYASQGFDRLRDINCFDSKRVKILTVDLGKKISEGVAREISKDGRDIDFIINIASESHVDRSISNPIPFIKNNVNSVLNILEYARTLRGFKKFIQFSCYDKITRAVTRDGLKYYNELTTDDYVLTLNSKKEPEFQKIENIIIQDYDGDMIKFGGISDLLVTPNHRMYNDNMEVMEASEISKRFEYPKNVAVIEDSLDYIEVDGIGRVKANDLLYLTGVFIGDGFTAYQEKIQDNKSGLNKEQFIERRNKRGQFVSGRGGDIKKTVSKAYRIFFDVPKNDKARKRLEKTLSNLNLKWYAEKGKSGEHIYLTSKELVKYFDDNVGKGAKNKRIPKFYSNLGKDNLKALYDGLIDSDGYYGNKHHSYTTISKNLVSDIVLLSFLLGKRTSVSYKYSESKYDGRDIKGGAYQITITDGKLVTKQIDKEKYKGKIWCIKVKNKNFLVERNGKYCFSGNTDEVYGTAPKGTNYKEGDRHNPGNPYSASKSAQEAIARAYANTYKLPIVITNTMNVIGERQDKEKFIPLCINKSLKGETITIHADRKKMHAGTRFYIHARNVADALLFILLNNDEILDNKDSSKGVFNIVGEKEIDNLTLAQMVNDIVKGNAKFEMVDFHSSRPGHDLRYALNGDKLKKLGFKYKKTFESSLEDTIKWTLKNNKWLK